jgi:zinc transport system substrate-binding protein
MFKIFRLTTISLTLLSVACTIRPAQENRVMVTIEPQRYFVEQLVDTLFEVVTMVPPGSSPESYDPTPREMVRLARSKAYFCIGHIGFENVWLEKLKSNHPNVLFFDNSQGIALIAGSHHHHHEGEDCDDSHSSVDPHTWSSPRQARIIVENMFTALSDIDPEHIDIYSENREKILREIEETDRVVGEFLKNSSQKAFIIYHPALSYLARDYGLTQYAIETDGKEPSPEQIRQLVDFAQKESIRIVFIQQEFDRKNAEIIARETGCRVVDDKCFLR